MPKFKLCFYGSTEIEAHNAESALNKFYELIEFDEPLPSNLYKVDQLYELDEEGLIKEEYEV